MQIESLYFTGNEGGYFAIDRLSGEIMVAKSLLLSESIEAVLTIRATDESAFKLSDTCTVRIQTMLDELLLPSFQRLIFSLTKLQSFVFNTGRDNLFGFKTCLPCSCLENCTGWESFNCCWFGIRSGRIPLLFGEIV